MPVRQKTHRSYLGWVIWKTPTGTWRAIRGNRILSARTFSDLKDEIDIVS